MKKTETIAFYREAFLEGKDEEARRRFDEKDVDKQYASIISWKRRRNIAAEDDSEPSVPVILEMVKKARRHINILENLSQRDSDKLLQAINELFDDVANFHRIRKEKLIRDLEAEKEKIARQEENLARKIEALRQELS